VNFIHRYDSPLGGITEASDGKALTGLWFDGQKYFADTLDSDYEEKRLPVFEQTDRWLAFKNTFHHDAPKLEGRVRIIDGDQTQRLMFNRLTISQAHEAVFGRSPNIGDYL